MSFLGVKTASEFLGVPEREDAFADFNMLGPSTEPVPQVGGFMGKVVEPTVQSAAKILPMAATFPATFIGSGLAGAGTLAKGGTLAEAEQAMGTVGERVSKIFGIESPEERKALEYITKPFEWIREGMGVAGQTVSRAIGSNRPLSQQVSIEVANRLLLDESEQIKSQEVPYLAPIIATLGEASLYIFGPKVLREIGKSEAYRSMPIKERGLAVNL